MDNLTTKISRILALKLTVDLMIAKACLIAFLRLFSEC